MADEPLDPADFNREAHPDSWELPPLELAPQLWGVVVSLNHNLRVLANEARRIADAVEELVDRHG